MKRLKILAVLFLLSVFVISCTDNRATPSQRDLTEEIIGDYEGNLNDIINSNKEYPAVVSIERMSNNSIQMKLHSELMDTTIAFDLYENMDSLMVCFNSDGFKNHYGHEKGGMHHMRDDDEMYNWMHHLDEDHEPGEKHFGCFDTEHHSFNYDFYSEDNQRLQYRFEGEKK